MLRDQEQGNSFTPDNTPSTGEWIWADIKQMAAYSGAQPVLVDEIFSSCSLRHCEGFLPPFSSFANLSLCLKRGSRWRDLNESVERSSSRKSSYDRIKKSTYDLCSHMVRLFLYTPSYEITNDHQTGSRYQQQQHLCSSV